MVRLKFEAAILLRAILLLTPAPFCATGLNIDSRIYVQHLLLPAVYDSCLLPKFIPPIPIIETVCVCVCVCVEEMYSFERLLFSSPLGLF